MALDRSQTEEMFWEWEQAGIHRETMEEIRRDYSRIDEQWLRTHYIIFLAACVFSVLVEAVIGLLLLGSGTVTIAPAHYWWRYLYVPGLVDLALGCAALIVMRLKLSLRAKTYVISLSFVMLAFILFTVHTQFSTIYCIFTVSMLLTVAYASYLLTVITAGGSLLVMTLSELFIFWDPEKISVWADAYHAYNFAVALCILIAFSAGCIAAVHFVRQKNKAGIQAEMEQRKLRKRIQVDELTGVFNRAALQTALNNVVQAPRSEGYILAIADIDSFKSINDRLGHHLGDQCLVAFSKILKENTAQAVPFRYGGDEFCLLFRGSTLQEAAKCCEGIQGLVRKLHFEEAPELRLTSSIGLSEHREEDDAVRFFVRADLALYEAKKTRDRVYAYPEQGLLQ